MYLLTRSILWIGAVLLIARPTVQSSCHQFQMKKENLNKRLLGYKLFERKVSVHHECAYECMFFTACKSINFISSSKTCELNSEGSEKVDSSDFEEEDGTTFSDITDWPMAFHHFIFQSMVSGCEQTKRCFPFGKNTHKCIEIACDEPKHSEYGVVQSGSNIAGSVRLYVFTCPQHTSVIGETSITCLLNGEWSPLAATCKVQTIGTDCVSNADCSETGAECIEAKCYCGRLYRYSAEIKDCVKVCSGMTNTFTIYPGTRMNGYNDIGRSTQTYTECLQLCTDDEDCLSFEHVPTTGNCQRSSHSKEMVEDIFPDIIKNDLGQVVLYSRDCH